MSALTCDTYNNIGIFSRLVITVIVYFVIYKYWFSKESKESTKSIKSPKSNCWLLVFAIILAVVDSSDCNWGLGFYHCPECSKTFYYQIMDKINDSLSYLAAWQLFGLDNLYFFFALFRCVGVILFGISRDATYLILFPDLNKEYLVYLFLFGYNYRYIWLLVLGKMAYEYYHHTNTNKRVY